MNIVPNSKLLILLPCLLFVLLVMKACSPNSKDYHIERKLDKHTIRIINVKTKEYIDSIPVPDVEPQKAGCYKAECDTNCNLLMNRELYIPERIEFELDGHKYLKKEHILLEFVKQVSYIRGFSTMGVYKELDFNNFKSIKNKSGVFIRIDCKINYDSVWSRFFKVQNELYGNLRYTYILADTSNSEFDIATARINKNKLIINIYQKLEPAIYFRYIL